MLIAGPLWGNFISRYVELHIPDDITEPHLGEGKMPSFGFSLSLILLPLVLVGLKTIAARFVAEGSDLYNGLSLSVTRSPRFWWRAWWRFMAWRFVRAWRKTG
jgi:H+/gluconate symporter-like permease